jgi:glycosyltransferase involved in cell wall biosynthesis
MKTPKVSILLPVYNAEEFIRDSVDSLIGQTFADFELLILEDKSTDGTLNILESYSDPRIRLIRNDHNKKLIANLNQGIELAKGEYIARMDADDIAHPERLSEQVGFLDQHTDVIVLGSNVRVFGNKEEITKLKLSDAEIKLECFFVNPFYHPSVMIRASVIKDYGLTYSSDYIHIEDYFLWTQCAQFGAFANIERPLLQYRVHGNNISMSQPEMRAARYKAIYEVMLRGAGLDLQTKDVDHHYAIVFGKANSYRGKELSNYLDRLESVLKKKFQVILVRKRMNELKMSVLCQFADLSARESISFAVHSRTLNMKALRYIISGLGQRKRHKKKK